LSDVSIIHEYRQKYFPEISKQAGSFDIIAAEAIFDGLVIYGWIWDEITSSRTPLINQLRIHLSRHNFSLDMIRQAHQSGQTIDIQSYYPPSPPYQESSKKRTSSSAQSRNEENVAPLQSDSEPTALETDTPTSDYQVPIPTRVEEVPQGGKSSYIRIALALANKGTVNISDSHDVCQSQISPRNYPHVLASGEIIYGETVVNSQHTISQGTARYSISSGSTSMPDILKDFNHVNYMDSMEINLAQFTDPMGINLAQFTAPMEINLAQFTAPMEINLVQITDPMGINLAQFTAPMEFDFTQFRAPMVIDLMQSAPLANLSKNFDSHPSQSLLT
jgi:hypothetical protein